MSAASVIATIALAGVVFMLGFLVALLREGAPAVCYWVVPVHKKTLRRTLEVLIVGDHAAAYGAGEHCNHCVEVFENKNHDNEKYDPGFISIDGNTLGRRLGWSSIQPRGNNVFREQRFRH